VYFLPVAVSLVVRTSAVDLVERLVSKMACHVLSGTLNFAYSLLVNPLLSSRGYTSNVQCHTGLTYRFKFLTFGHSGAQLSARVSECQKLKTVG